METKLKVTGQIRLMLGRDIVDACEIEKLCYSDPWDLDAFKVYAKRKSSYVAVISGRVAGFMVYENNKNHVNLLNMAVHPNLQRKGIGTAMMKKIKGRLSKDGRRYIKMVISERCDNSHIFLRNMGFKVTEILHNYFDNDGSYEDAYQFMFDLNSPYEH